MHLSIDIDRKVMGQIDRIAFQLAQAEGVTEDRDVHNQLGQIQAATSCHVMAADQVIQEIVPE